MKEDKNLRLLKKTLKKIKENKTFKELKIRGIDSSYLIYPNFSKNIYNLINDSKINLFGRVFLTNFLKHIRNLRVKMKKNSKLTQKDILYIIFNKREFHEEISKFLNIMDKKNTNLIIREPYFKEFGAYKLIPKDIDYSFFNNHIDFKIKKQWKKEKRKLSFHYKKLIKDSEFRKIFIINEKNKWREAKIILKNFFLEELYWSALIILITEKIIKIAKPKIFINSNCFSYCTREVALTMKKEGVKVVNIAECIMDFDKKFLEIIFNAKGLFKNYIDYFLSWGKRDKKKVEKSCFVKIIGSTKQPPIKYLKNISKKNIVTIVLSTHSELENKRIRLKIIRILKR